MAVQLVPTGPPLAGERSGGPTNFHPTHHGEMRRTMKVKVDRGDMVFLRPGVSHRDKPLPTTIPYHVINVAAHDGNDAVLVVREASLFQMLTADGLHIDRTHGIYLSLTEVAAVEAAA